MKTITYPFIDTLAFPFETTQQHVFIVGYQIVQHAMSPFLQFLAIKDDVFTFPSMPKKYIHEVIALPAIKKFLSTTLYDNFITNATIEQIESNINYTGTATLGGDTFVFFDVSSIDCIHKTTNINALTGEFITPYEIINKNTFMIHSFHSKFTLFFNSFPKACILENGNHEAYPIPTIAYISVGLNNIDFITEFGNVPEYKPAIFGQYYYFYDFDSAYIASYLAKAKGVVRIALFLFTPLFVEITKTYSPSAKLNIYDLKENEAIIKQIPDNWTETHDSIVLFPIYTAESESILNTPLYTTLQYEQHYPINYYTV